MNTPTQSQAQLLFLAQQQQQLQMRGQSLGYTTKAEYAERITLCNSLCEIAIDDHNTKNRILRIEHRGVSLELDETTGLVDLTLGHISLAATGHVAFRALQSDQIERLKSIFRDSFSTVCRLGTHPFKLRTLIIPDYYHLDARDDP